MLASTNCLFHSVWDIPGPDFLIEISSIGVSCCECLSSVQFSCLVMSDSLRPHGLPGLPVHHQFLEFTQTHVHWVSESCHVYPNPFHWVRCHPAISSSAVPFPSCLQSFPASGSFQISQFLASGGRSIGVSASTSVLPRNIQDWFALGWTGWISLQSKGLSRVFSNTQLESIYS